MTDLDALNASELKMTLDIERAYQTSLTHLHRAWCAMGCADDAARASAKLLASGRLIAELEERLAACQPPLVPCRAARLQCGDRSW